MGDFWFNTVTLLAILVALGYFYLRRCFTYWERMGVYSEPVNLFLGNVKEVFLQHEAIGVNFKNFYLRLREKGLPYGGYYSSIKPIFVPTDLDLIHNMMVKDFAHFTDHTFAIDEHVEPLAGHLFNLKGSKWRKMRAKLTPTFTSGKMKMMFNTLLKSADDLDDVLNKVVESKESALIKEISARFSTDVIMSCAFGLEANCQKDPDAEFRKYGIKIFESTLTQGVIRFIATLWPKFVTIFRISPLRSDVSTFFKSTIRSVVEYREANNIKRKDFMHLMIQLKNNVDITQHDQHDEVGELKGKSDDLAHRSITMDDLMANAFVFWLAGFETSSTATSYCMLELAQNEKIQNRLRDEIKTVLARHGGQPSYEALQEMTYLDRCINEILRKYPPVPIHARACTEAYQIPDTNIVLKKGDHVFISLYGIQNDPEHYPDPEKYDPDRFLPENIAERHPAAWMPFGDGPRLCIGLRFGMMQTKVALITMLRNFKYKLNNKTQLPLHFDPSTFLLSSKGAIWLDMEKI